MKSPSVYRRAFLNRERKDQLCFADDNFLIPKGGKEEWVKKLESKLLDI